MDTEVVATATVAVVAMAEEDTEVALMATADLEVTQTGESYI